MQCLSSNCSHPRINLMEHQIKKNRRQPQHFRKSWKRWGVFSTSLRALYLSILSVRLQVSRNISARNLTPSRLKASLTCGNMKRSQCYRKYPNIHHRNRLKKLKLWWNVRFEKLSNCRIVKGLKVSSTKKSKLAF